MQMWHKLTARAECSCLLFRKKMFFCFNIFYPKQQKFQMLCFITQLFLQFAYLAQDPSMRHVSCRVESVGWYVMVRWPELNPHPPMKHFSHIFIMTDMNKVRTCKIYKERQRKSWGIHLTDYLSERWQHVLWRLSIFNGFLLLTVGLNLRSWVAFHCYGSAELAQQPVRHFESLNSFLTTHNIQTVVLFYFAFPHDWWRYNRFIFKAPGNIICMIEMFLWGLWSDCLWSHAQFVTGMNACTVWSLSSVLSAVCWGDVSGLIHSSGISRKHTERRSCQHFNPGV